MIWLLVRWHGSDYTFGTSSVPSQLTARIVDGDSTPLWIPLALVSIAPSAYVPVSGARLGAWPAPLRSRLSVGSRPRR